MCTAIGYRTKDFYFGRTLDYEMSFDERVTVVPRRYPLLFRHTKPLEEHYAMIGMAAGDRLSADYPLFYDGANEKGLCMAGLNFVGNAVYGQPTEGKRNLAVFELIPWILGRCASVSEAVAALRDINVTDTPFREDVPPARLHWMIADRDEAVTVESVADGLMIYPNPVGVLTNNPPFPMQMFALNNYGHLSCRDRSPRFAEGFLPERYSRGMGAMGLPGDWSSQSRFVRAAFVKLNSVSGESEEESVGQFFHILGTVEQVRGCCEVENGRQEITLYTSCINADRGVYYYTTYGNRQITAVNLHGTPLDGKKCVRYPLVTEQRVFLD